MPPTPNFVSKLHLLLFNSDLSGSKSSSDYFPANKSLVIVQKFNGVSSVMERKYFLDWTDDDDRIP